MNGILHMDTLIFALWFFLPAGIANAVPILAANTPVLKKYNLPLDFSWSYKKKRLFGKNKTWRGLIVGILAAIAVVYLQQLIFQSYNPSFLDTSSADYLFYSPLLLGILFGFGALVGDAIESFFKRQADVPAGDAWFPHDQIDYIIGGCVAVSIVARLSFFEYATVLGTWFLMHLFFSYIGYLLHLKPKPI